MNSQGALEATKARLLLIQSSTAELPLQARFIVIAAVVAAAIAPAIISRRAL